MNYTRHFECGCKVVVIGELTNAEIRYCSKHKAAPDMYEALEAFDHYLCAAPPHKLKLKAYAAKLMEKALAKAEGRE